MSEENQETQTPEAEVKEPTQEATSADKLVPESDLVKVKGGLQKQLDETKAKLDEAYSARLQAEAKVLTLEESVKNSAGYGEELEKTKAALEDAMKNHSEAAGQAVKYRRELISTQFGVPDSQMENYSMQELDMFERALKTVKTATGGGQYATGGVMGGSSPATQVDRALANLQRAQVGVSNPKQ